MSATIPWVLLAIAVGALFYLHFSYRATIRKLLDATYENAGRCNRLDERITSLYEALSEEQARADRLFDNSIRSARIYVHETLERRTP